MRRSLECRDIDHARTLFLRHRPLASAHVLLGQVADHQARLVSVELSPLAAVDRALSGGPLVPANPYLDPSFAERDLRRADPNTLGRFKSAGLQARRWFNGQAAGRGLAGPLQALQSILSSRSGVPHPVSKAESDMRDFGETTSFTRASVTMDPGRLSLKIANGAPHKNRYVSYDL